MRQTERLQMLQEEKTSQTLHTQMEKYIYMRDILLHDEEMKIKTTLRNHFMLITVATIVEHLMSF